MDDSSEARLLAALRAGSADATRAFVSDNIGRMHAVARRIVGSDADAHDVVQDAFLRAFQSLDSFRGASRLSTWLHRIVVNEALMRLRARKRHDLTESVDQLLPRFYEDGHRIAPMPSWSESAEVLLQKREVRAQVTRCIDSLPAHFRTILVLRDIEGLSTKEVAAALDISAGAVKTKLHRARQALRCLLEKELSA
ncbi:MAG: RNA polymerase sigma factor [Haliangiales bacterium]